jgi:hypothetical protein
MLCCARLCSHTQPGRRHLTCEIRSVIWLLYMSFCIHWNLSLCNDCAGTMVRIIMTPCLCAVTCLRLCVVTKIAEVCFRKYFTMTAPTLEMKCFGAKLFTFDNSYDKLSPSTSSSECFLRNLKTASEPHMLLRCVERNGKRIRRGKQVRIWNDPVKICLKVIFWHSLFEI